MQTLDQLFPPRPTMPIVTRELFNSSRYVATLTRAGLIVQSHRKAGGRIMPATHPQFNDYVSAFEDETDVDVCNALCRALLV